jgi:hypothetical protein
VLLSKALLNTGPSTTKRSRHNKRLKLLSKLDLLRKRKMLYKSKQKKKRD